MSVLAADITGIWAGQQQGRRGEPEDVASMVTYLASPLASWITGQTYPVNGGYAFAQ